VITPISFGKNGLVLNKMVRLAILSTHPIQYNAPAFRELAARPELDVRVFYEWKGPGNDGDPEFGRTVNWDIPLLDGYSFSFVENVSKSPGTHHFRGIDNPGIVREIAEWKPDAILVYGWSFLSHLRVLRFFHGKVPILFRGDSTLLEDVPGFRSLIRRRFLTQVYRYVDIALFAGVNNRVYFEAMGLRGDRLIWAPHAVENDRMAAGEASGLQIRESFGIGPKDVVLLFAGKLVEHKNPELLLNAFARARAHRNDSRAHLFFAGDGELLGKLKGIAGRSDQIHFLGFQNQSAMPGVYNAADVLVLPSRRETWGLSVNESMAAGRAAIVSDRVGCQPDLVKHDKTGFVFPRDDVSALQSLIERVVREPGVATLLGSAARSLIKDWTIQRYASQVAEAVAFAIDQFRYRARRT
jgi:glycosyltransferase involved in cell wall biosynthesis